jgi:hypothetical protein
MSKFSLFQSAKGAKPSGSLSIEQLYTGIKEGTWKTQVLKVRDRVGSKAYRVLKEALPGVTVSGKFSSRDVSKPVEGRLVEHSGYIAIDVDGKDNPKLRITDLIDREAVLQFVSPGGKGIKIIYACKPVKTAQEHRRIYDAAIERLAKLSVTLKADPVVKSLANLQFVSYDPNAYYNPKSKLVLKPLPPIKIQRKQLALSDNEQLKQLQEYIEALGTKDITGLYEDWLNVLFGLSYSFGEMGRDSMHSICRNYAGYSKSECDEKFDACLESSSSANPNPITASTVFSLINDALPAAKRKVLNKTYNPNPHAIGKAEEINDNPDLAGFVRYKLFLFKKVVDKKTNEIVELQIARLNLNAFELFIKGLGFYRYQSTYTKFPYVRIVDNIVSTADVSDVLRVVTEAIERDGDYEFTYGEAPYKFSWEELALKWRETRGNSSLSAQIAAGLDWWVPNLLEDLPTTSFIPYANGVLAVDKNGPKLLPYKEIKQEVWKERILPREFKYVKSKGMFEDFYLNLFGRGNTKSAQIRSESYARAIWYFGYMLQGTKRDSNARAFILYDVKTGNNGRSGKTIVLNALGKIRSLTVIDGKRVDLNDRFAFQTIDPWTEIVGIDDVAKGQSLAPIFNMITGTTTADKKNVAPISKRLKYAITSNWFLESEGSSEVGRQFVAQASRYYIDYAESHGDTITPIVDVHGKEFFTDWNTKDWNEFDSFSVRCIQSHLRDKAPDNTIIGDAKILRFIQINEEETFFNLSVAFDQSCKETGEGMTVSTSLLAEAVRDSIEGASQQKAGRIIRAYFGAIGAKYLGISSASDGPGGRVQNVYKLGNFRKNLNFGAYQNRFGKNLKP